MLARISAAVAARPWQVIVGWVIATAAIVLLSPNLDDYVDGNQQNFLPDTFESVTAQSIGDRYFPESSGAGGTIVITRDDGATLTDADQQTALGLAQRLDADSTPGVAAITASPRSLSPDHKVVALGVSFTGQPGDDAVNAAVDTLRDDASRALDGTGLHAGLTGNAAILVDTQEAYHGAETIISIATVAIIVILLGLVFRSVIIAVAPIVLIGAVFAAAQGLTAWAAQLFDFHVSTSLASIMIVVLFGVGADYIVFLLFRYRERLRDGLDHRTALLDASTAVGRVIASSALTVIGAFAALFLARLGSLTSLAPGLILSVAYMLFTAMTVVPASISLLGSRRLLWPGGPGAHRETSSMAAVAGVVARRPVVVIAVIVGVLAVGAVFSGGYRATYDTLGELPPDTPSQQAYTDLSTSLPAGALSPTQVYATAADTLTPDGLQSLTAALGAVHGVASVAPPQASPTGEAAVISVILADNPYSSGALDTIADLRSAVPDGVLVGGQTAVLADVRSQLDDDTALVFPVAAAIVAAILCLLLRSLLAPLALIVAVGLTFAATLGVLTLVFLHGVDVSGIDFTTPIVLYLFVVAIGTDYNILMAERVRHEFASGRPPREASRTAVAMDAPTVVVAGAILALTFASLTLTGMDNLVELGTGVAVGVAVAAFGMAPMLVPSLAAIGGHAFWWPTRAPTRTGEPE
ncbi:putative membrane protein [Gordonia spumicola]|uniref:Putative membrane protein n=1 Tax=Gordonia spumicola TaxID=589161 RepID=A0A7I9VEE5_9ACTN|nr:MMPL family transporter [Gordonia spumicola]GEE03729.1 putative membrane protein [Gordonia spumicola]